jgi:cell wall assembly regulator SMI1
MPDRELLTALRHLEDVVARAKPELKKSLRKPASSASLKALEKAVFGGERLPEDLRTWFSWHDGQTGFEGLSPEGAWTLMSVKDAIDTWRFLNHPKEDIGIRPKPTWLPLVYNGAGDHVMYETAPKRRGVLFRYWHDSKGGSVVAKNLADWAKKTAKERAKHGALPKTKTRVSFEGVGFRATPRPRGESALKALPAGVTLRFQTYLPMFMGPAHYVFCKVANGTWCHGYARSLKDALDEITETVAKDPVKDWEKTEGDVWFELKSNRASWNKLSPKKVPEGLYFGTARVE